MSRSQRQTHNREIGMTLGILERIQLLNILPAEGNIVTLRIVGRLRDELGFSEDEISAGNIRQFEDGRITWDASSTVEKDVEIGDTAKDIIKAALKKLDDEKKLTTQLIPIWDKFVT